MHIHHTATIAELLGDFVAYRGLRPADPRLPTGATIATQLEIPLNQPLRKGDANYARVVAEMLRAARAITRPGVALQRLVLVGDTRMSDGGAFTSLCAATGWAGRAFICSEKATTPAEQIREGNLTFANRWSLLPEFAAQLETEDFVVDATTVVVIDLDKTLIGARGRNDKLIDAARLTALRASVADLLGAQFNAAAFSHVYTTIDQPHFHLLTGDNQDYVAYICLIIGSGVISLERLTDAYEVGTVTNFPALLAYIDQQQHWPSQQIHTFHTEIAQRVAAGDATPFKAFRRREFQETAKRMRYLPDGTPVDQILREELVLTGEVWQTAHRWQEQGALLFGLSDKPDEAALPATGSNDTPLHRVAARVVGESR